MKALYKLKKAFKRKVEGIFEGKGQFPYGNCIISYNIGERNSTVEVYNPLKNTYLDRIARFLEGMINPCRPDTDEWDAHGFRNEADYINYKYG